MQGECQSKLPVKVFLKKFLKKSKNSIDNHNLL